MFDQTLQQDEQVELLCVEDRLRPDALVALRVRLGERQRHELRERVLDEGRYEKVGVLDAMPGESEGEGEGEGSG